MKKLSPELETKLDFLFTGRHQKYWKSGFLGNLGDTELKETILDAFIAARNEGLFDGLIDHHNYDVYQRCLADLYLRFVPDRLEALIIANRNGLFKDCEGWYLVHALITANKYPPEAILSGTGELLRYIRANFATPAGGEKSV